MTSSNDNGYNTMIENLFTLFDSGQQINPMVQEILDALLKIVELLTGLKAGTKITSEQQVTKIFKVISDFMKDQHVKGEALFRHLRSLETGMKTRVRAGADLDPKIVASAVEYVFSSDVLQSRMAQLRGGKGNIDLSSMNSPLVVQAINNLSKNQKVNLMLGLNNFQRWWVSWANGYTVDQDKKRKGMVAAIIDGLAANKFVGGAMQDTVKMLGLLAGSWIKNKVGGNLGGFLGASAVVLTQVVAAVVPMVISALLQAGFNRLFLGPLLAGAGGAGGATGGGILASLLGLGGSQSNPVKTISKLSIKDKDAFEKAKLNARLQPTGKVTKTGVPLKMYRDTPKSLPANTKLVASLNKNTAALTKNAGWLGKLINSPLLKVAGKILKPLAYLDALSQGWGAIKDLGQGNYKGAAWRAGAGVASGIGAWTGTKAIASLLTGNLPAAIGLGIASGLSFLVSSFAKRKAEESEGVGIDKLLGTSPGRIFWVSPQHHLAGSSNGSTPYGSTHGGRPYINKGAVPDASKIINLQSAGLSEAGIHLLTKPGRDTFHAVPYRGKGERYHTAGYGHYGSDVVPGQVVSKEQALKWFRNDVKSRVNAVKGAVKVPITQNMLDALVSFSYNIGVNAFKGSTALKRLNAGDYTGAAEAMKWWNKGGDGKVAPGLVARRNEEAALLLKDLVAPKDVPRENSQQTVTIQTPSVSSTTEEVKAPEEPKVEVKKEEQKADINEILKMEKPTIDGKSEKKEEEKVTGGLTADIAKSILNGVDIPGNDTTFDMMTKCNMAGLLGGY